MKVKEVLLAFWRFSKNYDGDISCCYTETRGGYLFFSIHTDKAEYIGAVDESAEKKIVYFSIAGSDEWMTSDKMTAYVDEDGLPRLPENEVSTKTPNELAFESGKSLATVYKLAKVYGRLPTVEELQSERKPSGRPRKYW